MMTMAGMDPQLAAIYGTNQDAEDVEKTAAAELAEKLAADGEIDTASFTDEQIEQLARQALGGDAEEPEQEAAAEDTEEKVEEPGQEKLSGAEATEQEKVAQAKLAEADYLGRVMAHAYTQELRKIAAAQGEETEPKPEAEKVAAKGGKVAKFLKGGMKKVSAAEETEEKVEEPSALDQLAANRAREILKENGIELEQEKTSASEAEQKALADAVEARAFQMLQEAGYVQEETEATEEKK